MSARRKVPVVLDADEFDHLPEVVHVPLEAVDRKDQQAMVRLRELEHGGTALLIYSSRDHVLAAHGGQDLPTMALAARRLPALRRRLGFNVVLLDVALPSELRAEVIEGPQHGRSAIPIDADRATGEPLVYAPSRPFRPGDRQARLELQPLATGGLALLTYSSQQSLLAGCGPEQYYVRFPAGVLPEVMRQSGADRVLIDTPLPDQLRH